MDGEIILNGEIKGGRFMLSVKPKFRWTELLQPHRDEITPEIQARMNRGTAIHNKIYRKFYNWIKEYTGEYDDPDLPFIIIYHADLYSETAKIVIDVKPLVWGILNHELHLEQLSGYAHFLNAKHAFFVYYDWVHYPKGEPHLSPGEITIIPWEILRQKVLDNYMKQGKGE